MCIVSVGYMPQYFVLEACLPQQCGIQPDSRKSGVMPLTTWCMQFSYLLLCGILHRTFPAPVFGHLLMAPASCCDDRSQLRHEKKEPPKMREHAGFQLQGTSAS